MVFTSRIIVLIVGLLIAVETTLDSTILIDIVPALDRQSSSWLMDQLHQLNDIQIDPALLMHDGDAHQKLASDGFDLEQQQSALDSSSLHSEPISVA